MGDQIVAIDRISELPDFIIHQIMSYLSVKETAQTSILSKRWNCLKTSFPILNFDQRFFLGKDLATRKAGYCTRWEKRKFCTDKFIRFVDACLLRFGEAKVCMQKFRLSMTLLDDVEEITSLLNKWIELAVANEVKELDFNVQAIVDSMYSLPETIFSAKFLTTLKLGGNLELYSDTVRFPCLKKLALIEVRIDEQMVQKFFNECPLLEDLFFSSLGSMRFCVSHAPKLKIVTIDASFEVESIEIVAPSLQQCTLICLEDSCMIDMVGCPHLSYLELRGVNIEILDLISQFPLLEKMIVNECENLNRFAFSSNRLKDIQFNECSRLEDIDIDAPNLLSFSYECFYFPVLSINVPCTCSWKVRSSIDSLVLPTLLWFEYIKKAIVEVANQIKELSISIRVRDSFTLDKLKKYSPSLPREVGNLIIDVEKVPPSKYAALLDCLLWVCFPRILSIKSDRRKPSTQFIEYVFEKLINRDTNCCNSHIIKCWQHYLKDFKIVSFIPYEDPKPHRIDNLMLELPRLSKGIIQFHLDWCCYLTY